MNFLMGMGMKEDEDDGELKKTYSFKVFTTPPPTTTAAPITSRPVPMEAMEAHKTQLPTSASIFGANGADNGFGPGGFGPTAEDSEFFRGEERTPEPTAPGEIPGLCLAKSQ